MKGGFIRTYYDKLDALRVKLPRKLFARRELKVKKRSQKIKALTPQEKSMVNTFWGNTKVKTEYISLYNKYNSKFDPRYIPDNMYFSEIDTYFNNAVDSIAIDDKNLYDFYFHDVNLPKTIARKVSDSYLDAAHQIIPFEELVEKCLVEKEVIMKKAMNSNSGRGVIFWSIGEGVDALQVMLKSPYDYVVQEVIKQHPIIGSLHESSINTLRIVTLYYKEKIHVLSSVVRM